MKKGANMRRPLVIVLFCALVRWPLAAYEIKNMRVFYCGNSLTMNTMPDWQPELGRSAGKEWSNQCHVAAGAPIWMLRERLESDAKKRNDFLKKPWDAMTLQPFGWWGHERNEKGK